MHLLPTKFEFHRHFKVNQLVCKRRHFIQKAEFVFTNMAGREDIVALAFPFTIQNDLVCWIRYFEVNVKRATRLYLKCSLLSNKELKWVEIITYRKVKPDLFTDRI